MTRRGFDIFNKIYNCITFPTSDAHYLRNRALKSYFPDQWFLIIKKTKNIDTLIKPLEYIFIDTNKFCHWTKLKTGQIRQLFTYKKAEAYNETKFKETFQINEVPKNLFTNYRKVSTSTKLTTLQYRFYHNDIYTLKKLYKIGLVNSPVCQRCNESDEAVLHLLITCNHSVEIWNYIQESLSKLTNENVVLDTNKILFSVKFSENKSSKAINTIIAKIKNLFIQIERPTMTNSKNLINHQIKKIIMIEKTFMERKKFEKKWKIIERNIEN